MKRFAALLVIVTLAAVPAFGIEKDKKCGDGVCQGFENPQTCPADCGSEPEPPTPPTPAEEPDWELALPLSPNNDWDVDGWSASFDDDRYEDMDPVALYSNHHDTNQDLMFDFVESVRSPDYRALAGKKTTLVLQFRANVFGHTNPADHAVFFCLPESLVSEPGSTGCKFPVVPSSPSCMVDFAALEHPVQSYDLYLRVGSDIRIERMKFKDSQPGILVFNIHYEGGEGYYDSLRCECAVSIRRLSRTEWATETHGSHLTCLEYDDANNTVLEASSTEAAFRFKAVWRKLN